MPSDVAVHVSIIIKHSLSFVLSLYEWLITSLLRDMAQRENRLPANLTSQPFAGRLGGNQEFILDPKNSENVPTLKRVPDASPFISLREIFN